MRESLSQLISTIKALRNPKTGCKWDAAQTHESLIKNMREESEEAIAAILARDDDNLKEELGDVLLQVLFHSIIAEEQGRFNIADVMDGLNDKLTRRHPHVFGGAPEAATPEEAHARWKEIKRLEKEAKETRRKKR